MKNLINKCVIIFILPFVISCSNYKMLLNKGLGNLEQARQNAITDFAHTYKHQHNIEKKYQKPFDVFWVSEYKVYNDMFCFSIIPEINKISLHIEDTIGKVPSTYFPNQYKIIENKLFIWKDSIAPLQQDILNVLNSFIVLDSIDVKQEFGLLPNEFEDKRMIYFDDRIKCYFYFFCKRNIGKYGEDKLSQKSIDIGKQYIKNK